jgi:hypothetical protein
MRLILSPEISQHGEARVETDSNAERRRAYSFPIQLVRRRNLRQSAFARLACMIVGFVAAAEEGRKPTGELAIYNAVMGANRIGQNRGRAPHEVAQAFRIGGVRHDQRVEPADSAYQEA